MSPKRRMQRETEYVLQSMIVGGYLVFILLLFPLYYRNNYIDILEAKRDLFLIGTFIFIVLIGVTCICEWNKKKKQMLEQRKMEDSKWRFLCIILCVASWGTGMMLCESKSDAFWGQTGRFLGVSAMLCGLLAMVLIGRYMEWNIILTWCFLIGTASVYLLQILSEWEIDLLGMKVNLVKEQYATFSSTLGNINFNASFDCVVLSVGMVLFLLCEEKISGLVYGSWLFIGFMASFCCRSDSVFLGIVAVFFVLLWHVLGNRKRLRRFWLELLIFFVATCLFKMLYWIFRENCYAIDGVARLLQSEKMLGAEGLLLTISGIWVYRKRKYKTDDKRMAQKIYVYLIAVVAIGGIGILMLANMNEENFSGDWIEMFRITDAWGSYRGAIWKRAVKLYRDYSIVEKLFGCGINCLSYLLEQNYAQEMRALTGNRYIDVHNEFLQMLLTTGIVGVVGYFGMILSILKECVSKIRKNEQLLLGIAGITAFLAQGLVNNSQIVTMPIFFVGWGIYLGIIRKTKKC